MNASHWRGSMAALLIFIASTVAAGGFSDTSRAAKPATYPVEQTARFAQQVERTLASEGVQVALLARVGRPLSAMPEGMRYTHVGFAVRTESSDGSDGSGSYDYLLYNLYQKPGQPDVSELVTDTSTEFFSKVAQIEAGILIPTPALQQRLYRVITSPAYVAMHDARYSLIASPYTLGRQNCTEFVLDVINAALFEASDPDALKSIAKTSFAAEPVRVSPLRLLAGALFNDEVSLSDHRGAPPVTATFENLVRYLQEQDPGSRAVTLLP